MEIKIITDTITAQEVKKMAEDTFGDMVKAAVDVERKIIAIGGELHADAEAMLINYGSEQKNIWGINIYPDKPKNERIEYISLINIRPKQNNKSMKIEDTALQNIIKKIIDSAIQ